MNMLFTYKTCGIPTPGGRGEGGGVTQESESNKKTALFSITHMAQRTERLNGTANSNMQGSCTGPA